MKKSIKNFPFSLITIIILSFSLFLSLAVSYRIYTCYQETNDLLPFYENELAMLRLSLSEARQEIIEMESTIEDQVEALNTQYTEYDYKYEEAQMKYTMLKADYLLLENYKFQGNKKIAYLTFDDGPSTETFEMLNVLNQYNVKATFFVNNSNHAAIQEIHNQGHLLANHTSSHDYYTIYSSVEGFKSDIVQLQDTIYKLTGHTTNVFRFPGGSNTGNIKKYTGSKDITKFKNALTDLGYIYFDWNVDSGDASGLNISTSTIVNNVLEQSKGKREAIILMHTLNSKHTTTLALPLIIEGLIEQGFTFEILSEKSVPVSFAN